MLLTDKAKQDFIEWMAFNYTEIMNGHTGYSNYLNDIAFTSVNAHIQEWFDSVGYFIIAYPYCTIGHIDYDWEQVEFDSTWSFQIFYKDGLWQADGADHETRPEALKSAIVKANEIYNSKR